MCSIANLSLALNEINRVLKKEGKLVDRHFGNTADTSYTFDKVKNDDSIRRKNKEKDNP